MNRSDFRQFYAYNDWANDRLLAMLDQAFGEETDLRHTHDPRTRDLQETATHIVAAQAIWRSRWEGVSLSSMLDPREYPTTLDLRMAFGAERARFWRFFDALQSEEALDRIIAYRNTQGEAHQFPLQQLMQHVITHSAYHRGQVTARLIDLGHEAVLVTTDLLGFYLAPHA